MIIDSHVHAWHTWPYQPPIPDPARGRVEQLLWDMDRIGVDRAVIICAGIDHNADNNDYIAAHARRYPDRLIQFADVDCSWSDTYHTPGAAERLEQAVTTHGVKGFTHYGRSDDDGRWFLSEEGSAFLQKAVELKQILSIAALPRLQPVLREVARRFPVLPILCHHMALLQLSDPAFETALADVLASAVLPNIHIKFSGFYATSRVAWSFPYADCEPVVRALYEHFGPERMHWGSDYPVVLPSTTYQQTLEAVRTHCPFIAAADMPRILGDSLNDLLAR